MKPLRRPEWGPHWKGLEDAPVVMSPPLDEVITSMEWTAKHDSLMVVIGDSGLGKSFDVGRGAEACEASPTYPARVVWVELINTTSDKALLEFLYPQFLGVPAPDSKNTTIRELRHDIELALAAERWLLIVDEGQHASHRSLRELRGFFDKFRTTFSLVLCGLPEMWDQIPEELETRTERFVELEPLTRSEVVDYLVRYDPVFATADPELLRRLNHGPAQGKPRWWAQFLLNLRDLYGTDMGELTDEMVAVVAAAIKKRPPARRGRGKGRRK